jgi:hypothetical protein
MSTAGGSALLLLLVLIVIIVAVLYMRHRGGDQDLDTVEPGDEEEGQTTIELESNEAAPAVVATVPGTEATQEAEPEESAQIPQPPPPPPEASGPEFNQLLEDRASESELAADEETEMDGESEWEILD